MTNVTSVALLFSIGLRLAIPEYRLEGGLQHGAL